MATVSGPTPPGTGEMAAARSRAAANSTSPVSDPSAARAMPTSMTTAPGLIQPPSIAPAWPVAVTSTSARATWAAKSAVREWHTVTVAWRSRSSRAVGRPTRGLRPTTTARFPATSTPLRSMRCSTPSGVQGRSPGRPDSRRP